MRVTAISLLEDRLYTVSRGLEGVVDGRVGIFMNQAFSGFMIHDDFMSFHVDGDLHEIVIPLVVPVVGHVDHDPTPFDAIVELGQSCGVFSRTEFSTARELAR